MVEKKMHPKLRYIATRQCGYFTANQAAQSGYSQSLQGYHIQHGNWIRVEHGLYRLSGYEDSERSDYFFWLLWARGTSNERNVAISHQSAMYLLGLINTKPGMVHLTVSSFRNQYERKRCVLHYDNLTNCDCCRKNGLQLTSYRRTLLDMKPDLILESQWLNTVQLAYEKGLIDNTVVNELMGDGVYGRVRSAAQSWANQRCAASSTSTNPDASGIFQRSNDMSGTCGQVRVGRDDHSEWYMPNRSFTLVELLVIVAIILVVSSLLFPVLVKASIMAKSTACLNNLRQNHSGLVIYAENNHGFLPGIDNGSGSNINPQVQVALALEIKKIGIGVSSLACPEDFGPGAMGAGYLTTGQWVTGEWGAWFQTSYGASTSPAFRWPQHYPASKITHKGASEYLALADAASRYIYSTSQRFHVRHGTAVNMLWIGGQAKTLTLCAFGVLPDEKMAASSRIFSTNELEFPWGKSSW